MDTPESTTANPRSSPKSHLGASAQGKQHLPKCQYAFCVLAHRRRPLRITDMGGSLSG